MTKTEIRRYYAKHLDDHCGDRIVDIDFYNICGDRYVNLLMVSRHHSVWRVTYRIVFDAGEEVLRYVNVTLLG